MKTSSICLVVCLLTLIINVGCEHKASTDNVVTLNTIEASVARIGGRATVEKYLFDTSEVHQPALAQIETGDKEWVALGVKMLPYSDAGLTEGLLHALAEGMQHQPENVLPYLNKTVATPPVDATGAATEFLLSPEAICLPFILNEVPVADQLAIVQRTKQALLTVRNPALKAPCDSCLRKVAVTERAIQAARVKEAG